MKRDTITNQLDENDERHGPWELYYSNGQLWLKGEYKHGKRHGLFEFYSSDGKLNCKGGLNKNKDRGLWYELWHSK